MLVCSRCNKPLRNNDDMPDDGYNLAGWDFVLHQRSGTRALDTLGCFVCNASVPLEEFHAVARLAEVLEFEEELPGG